MRKLSNVLTPVFFAVQAIFLISCEEKGREISTDAFEYPPEIFSVFKESLHENKLDIAVLERQIDTMYFNSSISKSEYDSIRTFIESVDYGWEFFRDLRRNLIVQMEGADARIADTLGLKFMLHLRDTIYINANDWNSITPILKRVKDAERAVPGIDRFQSYGFDAGPYFNITDGSILSWEDCNLKNRRLLDALCCLDAVILSISNFKRENLQRYIELASARHETIKFLAE